MKFSNIITLLLLSSNVVLCDEKTDKTDILDMLSTKRKESFPEADFRNIKKMLPDDIYERVTKSTHEAIESGAVGKVGYGFLMGYSSGFCLKKVSKVAAFIIGGVFVTIQTLSYNGFLEVNYDKIRSDVENVLDVNKDGVLDEKDLKHAYNKAHEILSYNMPTGGGFTAGLIMGLRA